MSAQQIETTLSCNINLPKPKVETSDTNHRQWMIYRILAVIGAHPVCSASPSSGHLSLYAIQCNSMGIYIRLQAQPPCVLDLIQESAVRITARMR